MAMKNNIYLCALYGSSNIPLERDKRVVNIHFYSTAIRPLFNSQVFSPMPGTFTMSSGALKGPFSSRCWRLKNQEFKRQRE